MRTLVIVATFGIPVAAHADAPADATALFDQGIKDMQAGNNEVACKELAASLAKYSDSGTKGALAECYTKLGKVASAWNLWRDLADTAPTLDLRKDAASNAFQLESRLPHFVIRLKTPPVPGLAVVVNDDPVTDPTLAVPLPIDPGPFTVRASAADYNDWTQSFEAAEGKPTTVEIPALVAKPKPKPAPAVTPNGLGVTTVIVRDDIAETRHSRHVLGLSLGIIGIASVTVGAGFGVEANSQWNTAKKDCNGMIDRCPSTGLAQAQSDVSDARTSALVSTLAISIGVAAVVGGVIVYLSAPSETSATPSTAMRVVPALSPNSAGFVLSGGW